MSGLRSASTIRSGPRAHSAGLSVRCSLIAKECGAKRRQFAPRVRKRSVCGYWQFLLGNESGSVAVGNGDKSVEEPLRRRVAETRRGAETAPLRRFIQPLTARRRGAPSFPSVSGLFWPANRGSLYLSPSYTTTPSFLRRLERLDTDRRSR